MDDLTALRTLARAMGVQTAYTDGLGRPVEPSPDTLVRVCAALGAPIASPAGAAAALTAWQERKGSELVPPVAVAWDGILPPIPMAGAAFAGAVLELEDGAVVQATCAAGSVRAEERLPLGYHRLVVEGGGRRAECTVIAAPIEAYRRPGAPRSWGVGTQLAALRARRSRSVGDLRDLESVCDWIGRLGGDVVTVLPILPTFNTPPAEPSPYSPVSRLFWSELVLDLGDAHRPTESPARLDVVRADAEVRAALADVAPPSSPDPELARYARFRGIQARLGRNWRAWPDAARTGTPTDDQVDPAEERFHLVAQTMARTQLRGLRSRLDDRGFRLGLDLAVGTHPDGYDPWSRPTLFGEGMSVGAPPDRGFPSGQDWGFSPVLPTASRREGHRYLAASIAHQMELAGLLRVDHIMAWTRLYWIPHGFGLHEGTYVSYPAEELFAVLTLESARHRCEVVGENLGTVPQEIGDALPRHRIWGMYLAQFQAADELEEAAGAPVSPPPAADVALVGTHDTPTFAGWLSGADVAERVTHRLLEAEAAPGVLAARRRAALRLAERVGGGQDEPAEFLARLLHWLGRSSSPLVVPWLEDLWLEEVGVNLPGTRSSERPNWQRPMARLLDQMMTDPAVTAPLAGLHGARTAPPDPENFPDPRPPHP